MSWEKRCQQLADAIMYGAAFQQTGIEVYRNNYRGNLQDALAGAYPVIRLLLGEQFFSYLAKQFISQHPSQAVNLHAYGAQLVDFLSGFAKVQHLPYLPDMARLEWAYHQAYFAEHAAIFDVHVLASLDAQCYTRLRWRLHPSCQLLCCQYDVDNIWQAHQNLPIEQFVFSQQTRHLLVLRTQYIVQIIPLAASLYCFLVQLQQGNTLTETTELTLQQYPQFDLAAALQYSLQLGVISDVVQE